MSDLFPGFGTEFIETSRFRIYIRMGGFGPPLLCLHGYPETHAMWHQVAGELARHFTVVLADLPGYGQSSTPPGDAEHLTYSKRSMAETMIEVMAKLGHESFRLLGHDRGARVSYRMALDHPERVERAVLLDIQTTLDVWEGFDRVRALRMYHWPFLAQPAPLPETMIGADPRGWVDGRFFRGGKNLPDWLDPRALEAYRTFMAEPERIHATCEDYRAGATIDVEHDRADRDAGKRTDVPLLVLWGTRGNLVDVAEPLEVWRRWGTNVNGQAVEAGHFIPEENPGGMMEVAMPFLEANLHGG